MIPHDRTVEMKPIESLGSWWWHFVWYNV